MKYFLILLSFVFAQETPFKPKDEFEIKLDYQFKQRPQADHNSVYLAETRSEHERRQTGSVLPYLILNIKMLKLEQEEVRVRISKNMEDRPVNKKINLDTILQLDLGFTDDMKDQVKAYEYTVSFLSPEKVPVNRILIRIDKEGSFFVNGEKRGQF
jgi:hypothetical protein